MMSSIRPSFLRLVAGVSVTAVLLLAPRALAAWGAYGHVTAGTAAAQALPASMPAFFRDATEQLAYLNPEPDRWRDNAEADPALRAGFNPDHFVHIERVTPGALAAPHRFDYYAALAAAGAEKPESVGMAPYRILDVFERLRSEFRLWRDAPDAKTRGWIEQRIINDGGVLGHYVTDAANPLHTTVHHHGWTGPNPNGYAEDRDMHARFEGRFVQARIVLADVRSRVSTDPRVLTEPRQAIEAYIRASHDQVEALYQVDQRARFDEHTTADENRRFAAERLAFGATMLRDLWWTAWVTSEVVPTGDAARGR